MGQAYTVWQYIDFDGDHDLPHDQEKYPYNIDFGREIKKKLISRVISMVVGEVREEIHYGERTESIHTTPDGRTCKQLDTVSNPVAKEVHTWYYGDDWLLTKRETNVYWYYEDGTEDPTPKLMEKYYEGHASKSATARRRTNIVNQLEMDVRNWMVATMYDIPTPTHTPQQIMDLGRAFLGEYDSGLSLYAKNGIMDVVPEIRDNAAATHTWLLNEVTPGVTIKDLAVADLDFMGIF